MKVMDTAVYVRKVHIKTGVGESQCVDCGANNEYSNHDIGVVECKTCPEGFHTNHSGDSKNMRIECIACKEGEECRGDGDNI